MAQEPKRAPDFLLSRGGTGPQGSTGGVADGSGAVVETHTTDEGGEPQGSRKGRPRDPLEGRGAQADVSGEGNIVETQNSVAMYPKLDRLSASNQEKIPEERW